MGVPYNPFDLPHHPLKNRERQVITSGAEVLGGVLHTRAGIVVDVEENPEPYESALEAVDQQMALAEEPSIPATLRAVHAVATERIYYAPDDYAGVLKDEATARGLEHMTPFDYIGLSRFVKENIGICHQHALLSAVMLRLLQERGKLEVTGAVSIESTKPDDRHPDRHVQVLFATAEERITIDIVAGLSSNTRNSFALARA